MSPEAYRPKRRNRKWILVAIVSLVLLWPMGMFVYYGPKKTGKQHHCNNPEMYHLQFERIDSKSGEICCRLNDGDSTRIQGKGFFKAYFLNRLRTDDVLCPIRGSKGNFVLVRKDKELLFSSDYLLHQ